MRQVRLGGALDTLFEARARQLEVSTSELLRRSVRRELEEAKIDAASATALPLAVPEAGLAMKKVTLRVPTYVLEGARDRALLMGMKVSRWMVSLVQSNVAESPVLTDRDLLALEECARQLAAIGRNINQIARALHMAPHEVDRVKTDQLEYLDESIKRVKTGMLALIRSSRNAWKADANG